MAGLGVDGQLLRTLRPQAAPDELVAAGLVEPDGTGFRFRHPLPGIGVPGCGAVAADGPASGGCRGLSGGFAGDGSAEAAERVAFHLDRGGRAWRYRAWPGAIGLTSISVGKRRPPGAAGAPPGSVCSCGSPGPGQRAVR